MIELFSEKVEPTFTSSNHNILTVEGFEEIFFDVFEFEINGTKYIAEKHAEFRGSPVVSIPVVEGNLKKTIPFVLVEGDKFEVLYNKDLSNNTEATLVQDRKEDDSWQQLQENILAESSDSIESSETLQDLKKGILREIATAKKLAEEYAERIKIQKIEEANTSIEEKQKEIEHLVKDIKDNLVEEFNDALIGSRDDLDLYSNQKTEEIETKLTARVEDNFNLFFEKNNSRLEDITHDLNGKVTALVESLLNDTINPELKTVVGNCEKTLKDLTESINSELTKTEERVRDNISVDLQESRDHVREVESIITDQHITLNDKIKKGVDKALGRVGNIKSNLQTLEEEIKDSVSKTTEKVEYLESKIQDELDILNNNIREYYDEKINSVENNIQELTESQKEYFKTLIQESKESLLSQIKDTSILETIEEKYDPKSGTTSFTKDIKKIKKDLEKEVANRFSQEISSLKKLIEFNAGGGSVAKQFALGGVMDGDLQVNGIISSNCGNSDQWCNTYNTVQSLSDQWDGGSGLTYDDSWLYPLTGNWESTYTTVATESSNWDSTYAAVSLSASDWNSTYTTVGTNSAAWGAAGTGDFCSTTVLLNEVSACGGTMSVDGTLSASDMITTTLTADGVYFNTGANRPPELGELVWDETERTLDLGLEDGVVLQIGEEQLINVIAGEEIKDGQVVYASGAFSQGNTGKIVASLYSASSAEGVSPGAVDELFFIGVATQDIAQDASGYITTFGKVRNINVYNGSNVNTDIVGPDNVGIGNDPDWEVGKVLYVSTSAGRLTNTPPESPNKIIPAAMVISQSGNGHQRTLFVRQEHGYHIDELHDVRITNPQDGDVLVYNAALSSWDNAGPVSNIIDAYHRPQVLAINQPTITYDSSNGINAVVTLSADHTLDTITNAPSGTSGTLTLIQDSVGGHLLTVTPGNYYVMTGDLAATADMTANQVAKIAWDTHDGVNFYLWITYPVA